MRRPGKLQSFLLMFAVAPLFAVAPGCGSVTQETASPTNSGCKSGWAIILLGDGFIEPLCGCQEPSEATSSGVFSCTITAGSAAIFQAIGRGRHQILSTGTPAFISSPMLRPTSKTESGKTHVVNFEAAGTYEFEDSHLPGIAGRIIAQ